MSSLDKNILPKISKSRLRTWLKILKTSNIIEKQIKENFREEHRTTLPRFDVMSALYRSSRALKMNEISGVLKVSNGNITGIIDRLVKEGHVLRVAIQGDRRASLVSLTNKGKRQFEEYAIAHEAWINVMLKNLSEKDSHVLIDLLDSISGIKGI